MKYSRSKDFNFTIRILDLLISIIGISLLSPILIVVYLINSLDRNSALFYQERVGKDMKNFTLIKFRTMQEGTENCATHLVDPKRITFLGNFLRSSKIDELPQLFNVIKGDMSLVGPRPCLVNQIELINERKKYNIFVFKPGITGLAQIRGIDMSDPKYLAKTEHKMLKNMNPFTYFLYIFMTVFGAGSGDKIKVKLK